MKKQFYLSSVLILFFTSLLVGCSKEKIITRETQSAEMNNQKFADDIIKKTGNISGIIISEPVKLNMMLYGDIITLGPFYTNEKGAFNITNIPAGIYKLVITWYDPRSIVNDTKDEFSTLSIEVLVEPGSTTILDPIYL